MKGPTAIGNQIKSMYDQINDLRRKMKKEDKYLSDCSHSLYKAWQHFNDHRGHKL